MEVNPRTWNEFLRFLESKSEGELALGPATRKERKYECKDCGHWNSKKGCCGTSVECATRVFNGQTPTRYFPKREVTMNG